MHLIQALGDINRRRYQKERAFLRGKSSDKKMGHRVLLVLMYLAWSFVSIKSQQTPDSQLHSFMTNDEMAQYLETTSRDDIPEYEVMKLSPHKTKRNTHQNDDKRIYKMSAFGKDLLLDLRQTAHSVSPSGILVQRRTKNGRHEEEVYKPEGKFLHGHVVSDPGSRVALRETGEKGELTGAIFSGDHVYKVEPVNKNLKQRASLHGDGHHVVSRRSIGQRLNRIDPIEVHGIPKNHLHRSKRSADTPLKPKIVELMLTADRPTYEFYGNGTMSFLLNVANMVNRLYQDVSMGFNISVILTNVFIVQGNESGLDYKAVNISSAVQYLHMFARWGTKQGSRFPAAAPGHFDNGALITRRICGIADCRVDGVAYTGYLCNHNLAFSVDDATGLQVAYTVAHELGHNLGLPDDRNECIGGNIMNAGQPHGPNAFKWSHCSSRNLRDIMSRITCYDDKPATVVSIPRYPPGYLYDMDQQCKMAFGPSVSSCPITKENCGLLYCLQGAGCFSHTSPPVDGTPCGKRKWCMRGKCIDVGDGLPPSVDGQWSSWQHFTPCSRPCGRGVRHRVRYCNNPSPQYFGKPCVGQDKSNEEICNPQDCTTPSDPRTEQCRKDGVEHSYYVDRSPCVLFCIYGSVAKGHGYVTDGTPCYQNKKVKDVCIGGKCRRVGCDDVLESENPYDRCGVCSGGGTICSRVSLNYTKDYRTYGTSNPDLMFTIPVGAKDVMIKELQNTINFMSLKLDPSDSSYLFPVPSYTRTINAAGTVIKHYMTGYFSEEYIHIQGPTTQPLYAMFVYSGRTKNLGISCTYVLPEDANSVAYVWKVTPVDKCSASCAGGEKHNIVTCHRQDDGSAVGIRFCNQNTKPPSREACNTKPCPPGWKTGDWMMCSKSCAGGQRRRSVQCQQKITQDKYRTLPASSCSQSKPTAVEPCNTHQCPPYWKKSQWSKCSADCGGGTATRTVTCEQTLLNTSIVSLDDAKCLTELGVKPAEREDCNTMVCYVWDIKYSCKVCNAFKGYYHLGCYGDKSARALPTLLSANLQGDKVVSCYQLAKSDGYEIFAVQNENECWTSKTANETYDKHGTSTKCQNNLGGSWANDVYNIVHQKDYFRIGCFKDKHIKQKRPLPKLLSNHRDHIDWKHISKTVKECSEDAWRSGLPVFGLQYYGECWSGSLGHKSYDIDGPSGGCWEGVGGSGANYVYAFSRKVVRPTITCRHVVSNVKVPDTKCTTTKPEPELRLCNEVCKTGQ